MRAEAASLPADQEPFELVLHGGAPEKLYRRARPEIAAMPWDEGMSLNDEQRAAACRGWTEAALEEYAGAAQHAFLLRLLVRARAPLDLSAMAARCPLDELAHAELCARMALALGGSASLRCESDGLFPHSADGPAPELAAAELALGSCCVFETFAHAQLSEQYLRAEDPLRQSVFARLAKDEAAHAQFGLFYLDWLLDDLEQADCEGLRARARSTVQALEDGIARILAAPELHFIPGAPLGAFGSASYRAFASKVIRDRVEGPLRERGLL